MLSPLRVIKKYSNRKFYDTVSHKYVTLKQVLALYQTDGEQVYVVDRSNNDITEDTIIQAVSLHCANDPMYRETVLRYAESA